MSEGVDGGRIAEIVGGNVDGLDGRDGAVGGIADAFFEIGQLGRQRRLIAQPRGKLAHQPGNFGAGLNEAENIVDQQQHVLAGVVAEIFGHGQRGMSDAKTRAGRLVHLAEHQHRLVENAGGLDFAIELLAFAAALADAAEYADAAMMADHVVDQLHDQHGLADACSAEQAAFAAALERGENIDRLDAGDEQLGGGRAAHQRDRRGVHRAPLAAFDRGPGGRWCRRRR